MRIVKILPLAAMWLALSFTAPAWADAESGSGKGSNRGEACENAKRNASIVCIHGVRRYGACECGKDEESKTKYYTNRNPWTCTVNAYCKERGSTLSSIIPDLEIPSPFVSIQP